MAVIVMLTQQLQPARFGAWRDLFDAHLRTAATHLTDPAHHGDAPALTCRVLDANHFARLQFGGHCARPGQAITARTVVDHWQDISRKLLIAIGRLMAVVILKLRVLDFFIGQ
ncbi:hypothetical protein D3C84_871880 [compost metagenome]